MFLIHSMPYIAFTENGINTIYTARKVHTRKGEAKGKARQLYDVRGIDDRMSGRMDIDRLEGIPTMI